MFHWLHKGMGRTSRTIDEQLNAMALNARRRMMTSVAKMMDKIDKELRDE